MKKLRTISLLKAFIAAQLKDWRFYNEMEECQRASKQFFHEPEITSICSSQFCSRIVQAPTELFQELFIQMVVRVWPLCEGIVGISGTIDKFEIFDSLNFRLPTSLCE